MASFSFSALFLHLLFSVTATALHLSSFHPAYPASTSVLPYLPALLQNEHVVMCLLCQTSVEIGTSS